MLNPRIFDSNTQDLNELLGNCSSCWGILCPRLALGELLVLLLPEPLGGTHLSRASPSQASANVSAQPDLRLLRLPWV